MKTIFGCSLLAASLIGASPVLAQGIVIGPNGVGVDPGPRHERRYDSDHYNDYQRDHGMEYGVEEGRSTYNPHRDRHNEDRDDN